MKKDPEGMGRYTVVMEPDFRRQAHGAVRTLGYETMKDYIMEKLAEAIKQAQQPAPREKKGAK